jgi:hypothetical protein
VSDFKTIIKSFEVKDKLTSEIWEPSGEKMKPEVRNRLLEIAEEFINFLKVDVFVNDIVMTGSLSNYNWSEFSDVDLHIITDMENYGNQKELYDELFKVKKSLFNLTHDITVKGYDVELYVEPKGQDHFSSGIYSVLNDEWINEPEKEEVKIDGKKIKQKSEDWMDIIDTVIDEVQDVSIEDGKEIISKYKEKLRNYRTAGLRKGGEYSYENLVYKVLRRNGYLEKFVELENRLIDKELSLDENELF